MILSTRTCNKAIKAKIGPPGPSKKFFGLIKEWGLITIAITVPLALIAIVITLIIRVTTDISEEARFRTHTDDRLQTIEARLLNLSVLESPVKALGEIEGFKPSALAETLPALHKLSELTPSQEFRNSTGTLTEIGRHLIQVSDTAPDYWSTTLRFIQFATSGIQPTGVPTYGEERVFSSGGTFIGGGVTEEVVVLDGGEVRDSTFSRCRIILTRNNPVRFSNVRFINCVFEMPETNNPTPSLKALVKELLASGLSSGYLTKG